MDLSVKIGKAKFSNPVTVASGTFEYIKDYCSISDLKKLGALTPKTVTLYAQQGNPSPRIVEIPSGMINAIGIENEGIDAFISGRLVEFKKLGVPLIISVSGKTETEFKMLAEKLNKPKGLSAIELNLSCPNLKKKSLVAQDPKATYSIVKAVKRISKLPVIAKLTPNVGDITVIAKAAQEAGADGISMINTFSGLVIDTKTRKSAIGNFTGGVSGPAIRPMAVNMVYNVAQKVSIPIIGMGGIMTADDALQFIIAGATMVAVGTANFIEPKAPLEVLRGIKEYMKKNKLNNLKQLRGSLVR
ncbi:MAG: dihydroorotate dehydrogenase [Candidatus Omnitrophica bacterium]|nr:dihydroorotate dehydrogenase [Candidatus Omnitrophota bacterium]MBU1997753.1 dihydroorotate dehydrogenase [Candidatus Omnitrophota bacterium]